MANIITSISEAFSYDFVRTALEAGTVCALLAAVVGYFIVLRQMAFAGHALGHVGFAGACISVVLGWGALPGMLILTVAAGAGMGLLGKRVQENDVIIGMTLAFALGLGTFFLAMFKGYAGQATIILFGSILSVSEGQTLGIIVLTVASLVGLSLLFRPLLFATLEPELAEAKGVPVRLISVLFYVIVAIAVAFASQIVGVLLVFTLLIGPPAIAMRFCRTIWAGLGLSVAVGVGVTWISLLLAYLTDNRVSFFAPTIFFVLYLASAAFAHLRRGA
jgi:zinc/manganese transport system permease protein